MYYQTQRQTHHRANIIRRMTAIIENQEERADLIWPMIASTENPKARNVIKIKSVGNTRNRTRQNHRLATLIRPRTVTRYAKIRKATGKSILSNYAQG